MRCCNQQTEPLAVWDDAQLTDHAFNVYLCHPCGTMYKEDVWNDAGLRAIRLDGSVKKLGTDTEWEESGLLKGLEGEIRDVAIEMFRRLELIFVEDPVPSRFDTTGFACMRRVLNDVFKRENKNELLSLIDVGDLQKRYKIMANSEEFLELYRGAYCALNAEAEMTCKLAEEYVEHLVELSRK